MEAWPPSLVSEERLRSLLLVEIRAQRDIPPSNKKFGKYLICLTFTHQSSIHTPSIYQIRSDLLGQFLASPISIPLLCTLNQIQIHHRQPQGRLINRQSPEYRLHRIHTKEAGFAQISFYWPTKSSNVENCTHAAKTEMQARAPKNMITQYP